ncbi:hypothetical protein [Epilithonimonas xixisoli]|uniref:Uncharacterized protein n=1 Tax=Epilithonimonas xixisoli TaxID=1476462 RepID=A0A4R8I4B0_9FLAO|nr:hypothetical protein [Epilithonimonas xixisoli]TDX83154.1 hypothetical protein B0I22_3222 [Epilithonimonas xixisoli]
MKKLIYFLGICALPFLMFSCDKDDDEPEDDTNEVEELIGNPGNPRFNLQFTNPENVDLDLYVKTPAGNIISYQNVRADNGQLDVDCLCDDCPQGPNENIYWADGTAPKGKYEFWIKYYDNCGSTGSKNSDFTVRLVKNNQVLQKYTGSLNTIDQQSAHWTHTQD